MDCDILLALYFSVFFGSMDCFLLDLNGFSVDYFSHEPHVIGDAVVD